jgi:hypothetical protein
MPLKYLRRFLIVFIASTIPSAQALAQEATKPPTTFELSLQARDRFWKAIGSVDPYVLSNMISPGVAGGPKWPTTRQAYLIVRRGDAIILATDGMSDPFEDVDNKANGFGMELFVETNDIKFTDQPSDPDYETVRGSWAFELLIETAKLVANSGGLLPMVDKFGVISTEFPGVSQSHSIKDQMPARFITNEDTIGILIGQPAPDFSTEIPGTPLSKVRALPIVLLTAEEVKYIRKGGEAARNEVAGKLAALPHGFRSDLNRPSVVGQP